MRLIKSGELITDDGLTKFLVPYVRIAVVFIIDGSSSLYLCVLI